MDKPIIDTPILWGNDTMVFISKMNEIHSQKDRVIERKRIDDSLSELS